MDYLIYTLLILLGMTLTGLYLFLEIIFIGPNSFMALMGDDGDRWRFWKWMGANLIMLMVYLFLMKQVYVLWNMV